MSRVASEASIIPSHHHSPGPRRPSAAETGSSPFATLLDAAAETPPPTAHDRPERPSPGTAAAAAAGDPSPAGSARRGPENDRAEGTDAEEPAALATSEEEGVAEAAIAEAEVVVDHVEENTSVAGDAIDAALLAAATDAAPAQPPVTSEPVPAVTVLSLTLQTAEAVSDTTANDGEIEAVDSVTVATAVVPAEPGGDSEKPTAREAAADPIAGDQRATRAAKRSTGADTAATDAAATDAAATDTAATDAAATDAPAGDGEPAEAAAGVKSAAKSEHAGARPARAIDDGARTSGETANPRPVEPQIAATADKPSADVVQLVSLQHPAERLVSASSVAPGAIPAAATDQSAAAVPIAGLALEIAARAQSGRSRFEIRLDPPELGRIDVRLDVDRSGQVTSRLVVEKAETLDLLRRDAGELERALQQAGLKTGDNGLQFALRNQSGQNRDAGDGTRSDAARLVVADPETAPVETMASGYGRSLRLGAGIDIRV